MTENKRFEIKPSAMDNNRYVIHDSKKEYTFPVLDSTLNYMFCKALNELSDENEELKQRNDRQAKQLDRLYSLIEEKDWTALSDIIDEFKRCEEQLQKEWGIYNESG